MGPPIEGDIERQALLIALLECDQSEPVDSLRGTSGALFFYIQTAETQLISHPRLPNGALFVRDASDVQWLADQRYIEIRERQQRKRGFTFELTEEAHAIKRDAPRDVI